MADGIVKVTSAPAGDKSIDNTELTVNAVLVERQRIQLGGAGATELGDIKNAAPAGTEYGLITRNIPSGTQTVSGTVTVGNASLAVTGTFWQATQPISAASLPLPTGASTEATLALIKAKTDNLDVLLSTRTKPADSQHVTVDNASLAVTGTFWQATQPVSGTFWQATQPVSAASLPLPAGAAADSSLTTLHTDVGLLAKLTDTQPVMDSVLSAALGTASATPAAFTVLDRLSRVASESTMQKVLAAIQAQTAKPLSKPTTTLLHRS